jgi:hypothetical protein
MFAMADGTGFPAHFASAGRYDVLVDERGAVFTEQSHTINLRIEVFVTFVTPKPLSVSFPSAVAGL